jgi:hypothetical protein
MQVAPLPTRKIMIEVDLPIGPAAELARRCLMESLEYALFGPPPLSPKDARDAAIKEALACYVGAPSKCAKDLATDLARYIAAGWTRERDLAELPEPASELRRTLHRIARHSDGHAICWRQILSIAEGHRGR